MLYAQSGLAVFERFLALLGSPAAAKLFSASPLPRIACDLRSFFYLFDWADNLLDFRKARIGRKETTTMNRMRIASAVFFLLFAAFACAQEAREEPQPQEQKGKQDEAKPSKDEAKPLKQEKQETAKPAHEGGSQQVQERHGRPAGKRVHIPDEKFRASFGRQHAFAVKSPVIVEGHPRFQYSGYWFEIIDPWPTGWAYTDDCYIDYVDGDYFLFDVLHPGVRVALFVVM